MPEAGTFDIDLSELDDVIGDLERTESALESLTDDIERQIAALQSAWQGLAAEAQAAAQAEWDQGMRAMRAALTELRAAARLAHGNYSSAVQANLQMWESLS